MAGNQGVRRQSSVNSKYRIPALELWLVLALFVAYSVAPSGADPVIIWGCLLFQYALMLTSIAKPLTVFRGLPTFVTTEFLFLFFSYLIFFYPYQLHVLGIYEVSQSSYFPGKTFPDQSNAAILLSLVGMVSFRAGLRALRSNPTTICQPVRRRVDQVTVRSLTMPLFVLQAALMATYQLAGWKAAGEGRYTDTTAGGAVADGVYLGITTLSMVAVALILLPPPQDERRSIVLWLSVVLSATWAVRILTAGDRNAFLLIAIVAVGGFFTFRLSPGRWSLVVMCVMAILLYSAIEDFRAGRTESLLNSFTGESGSSIFAAGDTSFNISTISLRAALENVPDRYDYGLGLYKLIGLAGIVPFIRGILLPPDMVFTQSSDVLGDILLGPSASWGVGSNIIADCYVDFGPISVIPFLFLLGLGVAYVQDGLRRFPSSVWRAVLYLLTLALVAEIPRYVFAFPVRPIVWTLLLFWVVSSASVVAGSERRRRNTALLQSTSEARRPSAIGKLYGDKSKGRKKDFEA